MSSDRAIRDDQGDSGRTAITSWPLLGLGLGGRGLARLVGALRLAIAVSISLASAASCVHSEPRRIRCRERRERCWFWVCRAGSRRSSATRPRLLFANEKARPKQRRQAPSRLVCAPLSLFLARTESNDWDRYWEYESRRCKVRSRRQRPECTFERIIATLEPL